MISNDALSARPPCVPVVAAIFISETGPRVVEEPESGNQIWWKSVDTNNTFIHSMGGSLKRGKLRHCPGAFSLVGRKELTLGRVETRGQSSFV